MFLEISILKKVTLKELISMKDFKIEDVFGKSRGIPLNYVKRESIDNIFQDSLLRKQHIVVFGSSKQGKTCLRKNHLREDQYVYVQCSNKHNIEDLNEQILKQIGFKPTVSEKTSNSGTLKTNISFTGKFLAFFEGKAEAGYDKESKKEIEVKDLEIDLSDTNDIIKALKTISFSKFILLEDFHYLKAETQSDFAFALKSYFDNSSILFIIIGVWLEENRLIRLNGDLDGRVVSINADKWPDKDLENVIEIGSELLNIKFHPDLIDRIIEESYDNVFFVQEVCYKICEKFKIFKTLPIDAAFSSKKSYIDEMGHDTVDEHDIDDGRFLISKTFDIKEIIKNTVEQHSGRYNSFITHFDDGNTDDIFEIHKWLLFVILKSDSEQLLNGIKLNVVKEIISKYHPEKEKLKVSIISKVLKLLSDFQLQKKIIPNIVDYSEIYQTLQIVDKGFIIWLENQNRNNILNQVSLPID